MAAAVCAMRLVVWTSAIRVRNARYAQDANTASPGLRYLHGFHRWREVRPRGQPIPQPIQVVFQILLELLDRLPVHTGRTLVGLDLLVRIPDQPFRDLKRLILRLELAHPAPPERIG